ncbi:MAG TPA: hypothetical protein VLD67_13095 [Vicinamibacterales bacterium]|nr:hypothetical protein [Vicinamibacterales bacterium]
MPSRLGLAFLAALVAATTAAHLDARQRFTKQEADRFQSKLTRIVELGHIQRPRTTGARTTPLTDVEVTAYLRHHAKDQVPVGIVEPTLTALGGGRVAGRAVVDLDAVRKQKQRGWLDPLAYLTGRLPLQATGLLITQNGVGRFQLESADISGVAVPKTVVQELLSYYSRTPENPAGINMDDPFALPSRIREIRVEKGQAMVIQ